VDELGPVRVHGAEIEALEQCQGLEEGRTLPPRTGLGDGVAVIVVGERVFIGGLVSRHVLAGEQAAVAAPRAVRHVARLAETVDRLRDEAAIIGASRRLDFGLAPAFGRTGRMDQPFVGVGKS
jgi:tetrahydromethanopterin S-methyltransferase subunit F